MYNLIEINYYYYTPLGVKREITNRAPEWQAVFVRAVGQLVIPDGLRMNVASRFPRVVVRGVPFPANQILPVS